MERFILEEGHTAQRFSSDYSYDLLLHSFDEDGYAEPGMVYIQLKAAESLRVVQSDYVVDVDIADYNLWMQEEMPVVLILFAASRKRAYWLAVQRSFHEGGARPPRKGAKTVRMRVPGRQVVNRRAIQRIRELKSCVMQRSKRGVFS